MKKTKKKRKKLIIRNKLKKFTKQYRYRIRINS